MHERKIFIKEILIIIIFIIFSAFIILFLFPTFNEEIFFIDFKNNYVKNFINQSSISIANITKNIDEKKLITDNENKILISFDKAIKPEIGDYFIFTLTAKNVAAVDFPKGTISIKWGNQEPGPGMSKLQNLQTETLKSEILQSVNKPENNKPENNQKDNSKEDDNIININNIEDNNIEKFEIFVDGLNHSYQVNIGENPYWTGYQNNYLDSYSYNTKNDVINNTNDGNNNINVSSSNEKGNNEIKEITGIEINLPKVDGVSINVDKIELKTRKFFPVDSYINRFFRNNFQIVNERAINRFLIPTYISFSLIIILIVLLKLISKNVLTGKIAFTVAITILVIFSFYFMKNEFFTVKSYVSSYKEYIKKGDFKNTYLGFYDFEKFINWLAENISENENIIVLLRGEQTYIMSEMAYNLYPRDVRFVDISDKNIEVIDKEIESLNNRNSEIDANSKISKDKMLSDSIKNTANNKATKSNKTYNYIIALSKEDFIGKSINNESDENKSSDESSNIDNLSKKYILKYNYTDLGGFIYEIKDEEK